jgi:hypothetical protein
MPSKVRLGLRCIALHGLTEVQEDALQVLVKQLSLYPKDTIFFFNIWTPGWEEVIKFVAQVFHDKVGAWLVVSRLTLGSCRPLQAHVVYGCGNRPVPVQLHNDRRIEYPVPCL